MLSSRISDSIPSFATSDSLSLQVGQWLKTNYPESVTVVVTETPGFWFSAFCEKNVIVEINPAVERNVISESILDLTYEIETPIALIRAYEAKGFISSETFVPINDVFRRGTYCSVAGDYISYNIDNTHKKIELSQMSRYCILDNSNSQAEQNTLTIVYANDDIIITQTQLVQNTSYSTQVNWDITPVNKPVGNVTLYLSTFLDLAFNFDKAYLPGVLNWENPWTKSSDAFDNVWAVTDFSKNDLTDNYIAMHDEQNQVYYAMKFRDLPDWGNIGALGSMQIDAIRLNYKFEQISLGSNVSFSYQTLFFSENSYYQIVQPTQIKEIFTVQPTLHFTIDSRDYLNFIKENNVGFIVYDKNKLDTNIVRCGILELVYSNNRFVVFKVNN
jgi:hypothetical protein